MGLTDIKLGSNVSIIDIGAFYNNPSLKQIVLPESVTSIGTEAFYNCAALKNVYCQATSVPVLSTNQTFVSSPTVHVYTNALASYQNSDWAKNYSITLTDDFDNPSAGQLSTIVGTNPTALKVSGDLNGTDIKYLRSLINDYSLTSLDLSGANIVAGGEAYDGKMYVADNTLGNNMFTCPNLQSIVLPSTLQRMRYCCLSDTKLKELTIPASVTDIGESICASALQFEKYIVESGNTAYCAEDGVLYSKDKTSIVACPSARTGVFEIPNTVTEIFKGCFNNCRNLTSIIIPASVNSIGSYGLGDCVGLTSLICKAVTPPALGNTNIFKQVPQSTCVLKVPYASLSAYRSAAQWKDFATITSIEGWAETVTLSATSANLDPQQTLTLTATTDTGVDVVWTSSDESIARVANGVVTGVGPGVAEITATANDGGKAQAVCTVNLGALLIDGAAYSNMTEMDCHTLQYVRTFNNTEWQPLYVPFEMQYDDWKDQFIVASINNMNQYDTDDDGVADLTAMEIFRIYSGGIEANTPYLIRALETGEKTITLTDAVLYPADENSFDVSSWKTLFTFTGTYQGVSGETLFNEGYYYLSGGELVQPKGVVSNLKPYRWYMDVTDRQGNKKQLGRIRIAVYGETEINGILLVEQDGEAEQTVYDLSGHRVKQAQQGLYIVGGKKVLIK